MAEILVTGGAGYVGSHCCRALAAAGYTPVVIDNLANGQARFAEPFELVVGDIHDRALVRKVLAERDIVAVLHFAASAYVGESVAAPQKYYDNNVYGTMCLLDEIVAAGGRPLVFSSSCAVYGDPGGRVIDEGMPLNPISPYGFTKQVCERVIADYGRAYGFANSCLRYFNAAGADPGGAIGECHEPETHLIPLVLRAALSGSAVTVFGDDYATGDGTAVRDYVHVVDLGDAHVAALERMLVGEGGVTVNLGTGRGYSVAEVIDQALRTTGCSIKTKIAPRRSGDPAVLVADPTRAGDVLRWQPTRSDLGTIIADAWRWHSSEAFSNFVHLGHVPGE